MSRLVWNFPEQQGSKLSKENHRIQVREGGVRVEQLQQAVPKTGFILSEIQTCGSQTRGLSANANLTSKGITLALRENKLEANNKEYLSDIAS